MINIFGLSVGIACCVILALYIKDEFSYEQHFTNHKRIHRIYTTFIKNGVPETFPRTSPPIALELPNLLPEIEIGARVVRPPEVEQHLLKYEDRLYYEKNGYLVDSTFFDVFNYAFAQGDAMTALDQPSTVVLSDKVSKKIFGDRSPINETLIINSGPFNDTFRITGVLKPYVHKSHLDADFYMTMNSKGWGEYIGSVTTWAWQNFVSSYVVFKPNTLVSDAEAKMPQLIDQRAGEDLRGAGLGKELHFQPLDKIRLYSEFTDGYYFDDTGNITYVYILGSIGIFLLLIACINFMNLTTAKAAQRAGEVGVRKSLGASRQNLIGQFLGESFTIVIVSMVISFLIVVLSLPLFNSLTNKTLSINPTNVGHILVAMILISIVTGLIAGSYPAFYLSSFQAAKVLKDKRLSGGAQWLRKGLVVFQFVISITLISSIIIIQKQLNFIQSKSLGFSAERNFVLPLRTQDARDRFIDLRTEIKRITGIQEVSASTSLPSTLLLRDYALHLEGTSPEAGVLHRMIHVDENYFDLMGMKMLVGRDFKYESDSFSNKVLRNKVIVNEASLKTYGIDLNEAIGTQLLAVFQEKTLYHEIIGVIEDFHQFSLHEEISPIMFKIPANRSDYGFITMTLAGDANSALISQIEEVWKQLVPSTPYEYFFLVDNIHAQYEADNRVSQIITGFTLLAILISCLGLYGLSIYMAERRVKEIGIRKVLGASVSSIVTMLSTDFLKLILIAFIIAVPIGYYAMEQWLQNFAFRTELNAIVFALAGIASFLIAWITIGFESIRAAADNPVNSLKVE